MNIMPGAQWMSLSIDDISSFLREKIEEIYEQLPDRRNFFVIKVALAGQKLCQCDPCGTDGSRGRALLTKAVVLYARYLHVDLVVCNISFQHFFQRESQSD
jgi:hypothetical protein